MARILMLIILIWLLYQIIKRIAAGTDTRNNSEQKPEQKMVQCAQCGCHVPQSESQMKNDKIICSNPECLKDESKKT
jgi:hypothetical protein